MEATRTQGFTLQGVALFQGFTHFQGFTLRSVASPRWGTRIRVPRGQYNTAKGNALENALDG
jgi:hypothetical protein